MLLKKLTKEEWISFSEKAHLLSFGERFDPRDCKISFAYLFVDEEKDLPAGYMTVLELDAQTAYLQHGGVFPAHEKTVHVYKTYAKALKALSEAYETLTTRIENTNYSMLKMAMRAGFLVVGTYFCHPKLFLELNLEVTP
jgi:hypothetical protein